MVVAAIEREVCGFPAPTIPYPLSSSSDEDADTARLRPLPRKNTVLPPTPSLLSASSRPSFDRPQLPADASQPPVAQDTPSITVQRWISSSHSPPHEMDSYRAHSDEDEETGFSATDRRKDGMPRRGIGISTDESEEAALIGDDGDGDDDVVTRDEQKEADGLVLRNLAINGCLIGLWWVSPLAAATGIGRR